MSALAGRTFAIVALDAQGVTAATAAIESAGGEWQAFGRLRDPAKLRSFDAIISGAAAAGEAEAAGVPMLVIGATNVAPPHDFMVPPVRSEELLLRLQRLLAPVPSKHHHSATVPVILAADDDPTTTAILRAVVTQNAMTCHVARDGEEAIRLARELRPDAMILDVNMPHRDGFEVLSVLREDPALADVPVLMLTSLQMEADVVKGFRLGADDYVVKPFNPMELLARLKRLVRRD